MSEKRTHGLETHETAEGSAQLPLLNPHFSPERLLRKSRADLEAWLKKAKIKHFDDPEMEIVHLDMIAGAEAKIEEIQKEMERTKKETMDEAFKDGLTDLPNRKLFDYEFPRMAETAKRKGEYLTVIFIDLNRLKQTNDTYGHEAGDELIRSFAQRIKGTVRSGSEDLITRYGGGDEFVIVMPHANEDVARQTADKILQSLERPIHIMLHKNGNGNGGHAESLTLKMTAAIGISVVRPSEWKNPRVDAARECLKEADTAMYLAKQATQQHSEHILKSRLVSGAAATLDDDMSAFAFYNEQTPVQEKLSAVNIALKSSIAALEAELRSRDTPKKSE